MDLFLEKKELSEMRFFSPREVIFLPALFESMNLFLERSKLRRKEFFSSFIKHTSDQTYRVHKMHGCSLLVGNTCENHHGIV